MKPTIKKSAICVGGIAALTVAAVVVLVIVIVGGIEPKLEPVPEAYHKARRIWTSESAVERIDFKADGLEAIIEASHIPTTSATIRFADEENPRELFPLELYFGTNEIRFDDETGIIYTKVIGANAAIPIAGVRIFEYDVFRRKPLRDYWVERTN